MRFRIIYGEEICNRFFIGVCGVLGFPTLVIYCIFLMVFES